MMRIVAEYSDGFTDRLLTWKFESNGGKALLVASWFSREEPLRVKFRFDETPFADAIPLLTALATEYEVPITDLGTHSLAITDESTTISRAVYGAHYLAQDHPEVKEFLRLWQLLEAAVHPHLPDLFSASGVSNLSWTDRLPPADRLAIMEVMRERGLRAGSHEVQATEEVWRKVGG